MKTNKIKFVLVLLVFALSINLVAALAPLQYEIVSHRNAVTIVEIIQPATNSVPKYENPFGPSLIERCIAPVNHFSDKMFVGVIVKDHQGFEKCISPGRHRRTTINTTI